MTEELKKGWAKVAFGDVVQQVKDKVDPDSACIERYVAGEHMDTDDLKIRKWGTVGDGYLGPAFHMHFKPGHVLYGSRRTYLRKIAVADFEGITANTTYVIETKDPKILLQELLPFIMQAENFHEHSIKQSKGSVNPYINFSDLTWYEFYLPPIEDQRKIVEVLNLSFKNTESAYIALNNLLNLRRSMQNELLFKAESVAPYERTRLDEVATIDPTDPPLSQDAPFIPMESVKEWQRGVYEFEERGNRNGIRAIAKDVLMARITPCLENGKIAQVPLHVERCGGSTEFIVFRPKPNVDNNYLYWLISSDRIRNTATALMSGSTGRQRVSGQTLAELSIPKINDDEQKRKGLLINQVEAVRQSYMKRYNNIKTVHFKLINRIIEGSD